MNPTGLRPQFSTTNSEIMSNTATPPEILNAFISQQTLSLNYQGNPRRVIPLFFGLLKNGKEALLCYKINSIDEDGPDLSIRLYHMHKVSEMVVSDQVVPFSRKVDYYITKHFSMVFSRSCEQVHENPAPIAIEMRGKPRSRFESQPYEAKPHQGVAGMDYERLTK